MRKGEAVALYHPYDVAVGEETITPRSTWQEHRKAIRDGKLELLEIETIPDYTYELVCEDGKRRIFSYGGGEPQTRPKAK
jgi:hypothetical protein